MKKLMAIFLLPFLGCDFIIPLSPPNDTPWEAGLCGVWEQQEAPEGTPPSRLVVLPLDSRQLLAVFPAHSPDTLFAKAWRCAELAERPLYQIEWIGSNKGPLATNRVFQLAAVELRGNELKIRLVNPDALGTVPHDSRELASLLKQVEGEEHLFRAPMRFRKLPAPPS